MRRYLLLLPFLIGCQTIKNLPGIKEPGHTPNSPTPLPEVYTLTGTTATNFQTIAPVRVVDSSIMARVKRNGAWEVCDQFEVRLSTQGVGGGSVRFWYRNLSVNGVSNPVAPSGTEYEITSTLLTR